MIHLHVRSSFTLLKSTIKINELVERAKQFQMKAIALTDKNVMHGAMSFYNACKQNDIKPIFGIECDCFIENENFSFVLLAKDDIGYQNCLKLSTLLSTNEVILDLNTLKEYTKHCFVISSGDHSKLDALVIEENELEISRYLTLFNSSFDDYV